MPRRRKAWRPCHAHTKPADFVEHCRNLVARCHKYTEEVEARLTRNVIFGVDTQEHLARARALLGAGG